MTSASATGASASCSRNAPSSANELSIPFIFQLPATSGLIEVTSLSRLRLVRRLHA